MLCRTPSLLFLFVGFFLRIVPSSGMKEPLLHVTTNEPRMVLHMPELKRESRTTSSEESSSSVESSQEIESHQGILASEESTTHPLVNSEFLRDLIQNISSLHGAFKKSREHVGLETRHFTGIGRPRALLPPGQKRRRRVFKGHFNRTRPHVSSNPHIFAREGGDMAFGSKQKSKIFSDMKDGKFHEEHIDDTRVSPVTTRRRITLAPPVYKPGPAIVKIAPDLEDLKTVGLIKDHEYEKLKKEKSLKNALPMEIMKLKDQFTSETPDSEVKIPTYIVTTTFKPTFLNKNIVLDKLTDDNMALYVETEYSPTYSVPPHVLLSMMPSFDFRKYNVSALGSAVSVQDGQQHLHLQQSSHSVPLPSPSYFNSLSPTASSFIPPNPTTPYGRPTPTPYPASESPFEQHHFPLGPPAPSSMHSAPRHVYQHPRTYILSTVSPEPHSRPPTSPQPANPPAYSLHPGKAFMPPIVKYTTFEPLTHKHEVGDLENEHETEDLSQKHPTRKEIADTEEPVSYSPGLLAPIPATLPPPLSSDSSETSQESLIESSSGEVGSFTPHSFPNYPTTHPTSLSPPFEFSRETSHPIIPVIHHHQDYPETYTPVPQASRPAFPHRLSYSPPSPSPVPTFTRPAPTRRPTPSFLHRPVPPSLPPSIPLDHKPTPFPARNRAKTYRLTTPTPTTQEHHPKPQPSHHHKTADRRDKTLLNYNNRYWEPTINGENDSPIPKYPKIEVHRKSPKPVFVLPDHLHTTPRPHFARTSPATDSLRRRYPTPKLLRKPPQHVVDDYHPEFDRPFSNEIFSNGIIPGVPGVANADYPAYSSIPKTSFTCHGKVIGYYADPEARCQVFHTCEFGSRRSSFLCPNGTLFNQQILTCDHWRNVECDRAVNFYQINKKIYAVQEKKSYPYRRKKHTEPRSSKVPPKDQDSRDVKKIHSSEKSRQSVRTTISATTKPVSSKDSKPLLEASTQLATEPHRIVPRPSSTRAHRVVIKPLVTETLPDVPPQPIAESPTFAPTSFVTDPLTFESTPLVTEAKIPSSISDVPYPTYPLDLPTTSQPQRSRPPLTLPPPPPPTPPPPPLPTSPPPLPLTSPPPLPPTSPPPPPPPPPSPPTHHIEQDPQDEFLPVIQSMKPHYVNPLKVKPYVP